MKNVVVYTSNTCTYCTAAKEFLAEKGFEFEERNIKEPTYRKELMSMGFMSVPVIKVDEDVVLGFDKEKLETLLNS